MNEWSLAWIPAIDSCLVSCLHLSPSLFFVSQPHNQNDPFKNINQNVSLFTLSTHSMASQIIQNKSQQLQIYVQGPVWLTLPHAHLPSLSDVISCYPSTPFPLIQPQGHPHGFVKDRVTFLPQAFAFSCCSVFSTSIHLAHPSLFSDHYSNINSPTPSLLCSPGRFSLYICPLPPHLSGLWGQLS